MPAVLFATALAVATVVVLLVPAVNTQPLPRYCWGGPWNLGLGGTPLGTAMAIGTPEEAFWGGQHWYNFSMQSAGGGVTWSDLKFQVETSSAANVSADPSWTLAVVGQKGTEIARYAFIGGTNGW
jgi:hypothetical protein